ncbi:16S rRNA (guanine(527)-N(7))-methyltransferase RsmG [Polaromonas sp.]|uniref:16S rRNA (guanine(527)-N(7))-methyltransferase RsmG n=1 Tax=Polaromonas sp. TaxID=1869339 RepID=UPI0017943765|nr:16S rRNA (guanine(527)-N(7))-methyltransferase RsmG [Polaromonas sp.]NMM07919.1 16S rRNA (guanine(527)-N(7))-methyltransferase RsmG [Polaromonas sp.]
MGHAEQDLRAALLAGLDALGLTLSAQQVSQLLDYQALIAKWTRVYNLTAVRDPAEMMTHHLLDSLAAIAPLRRHLQQAGLEQGVCLLDVGSGAGLPGVVIAICCPAISVTCVDTVAKKAAFIKQAALALKLVNLTGLHARVESITQPFDVICSRAFASLADFTQWSAAGLAQRGVWMAMKGKHPADELALLPAGVEMFHVEQLRVPGLDAERCILWLRPRAGHLMDN